MHRRTVIHRVQVALLKVHDPLPVRPFDIGISNVPFFRHSPVKDWSLRWYLEGLQRNPILNHGESPPDAVAGEAPADRIQVRRETVQLLADLRRVCPEKLTRSRASNPVCAYSKALSPHNRTATDLSCKGRPRESLPAVLLWASILNQMRPFHGPPIQFQKRRDIHSDRPTEQYCERSSPHPKTPYGKETCSLPPYPGAPAPSITEERSRLLP
jgi:hypothetical protein